MVEEPNESESKMSSEFNITKLKANLKRIKAIPSNLNSSQGRAQKISDKTAKLSLNNIKSVTSSP